MFARENLAFIIQDNATYIHAYLRTYSMYAMYGVCWLEENDYILP
jgi:hypothetical protein